jgi:hypothetical protein
MIEFMIDEVRFAFGCCDEIYMNSRKREKGIRLLRALPL